MAAWTQGMLRSQKRSEELDGVLEHLSPKAGKDINSQADPSENASDGMTEKTKAITEQLLNRQRLFQRTRRLLQDPAYTGILFVLTPERLPINETQRALRSLTEEKLPVSGVIINRILQINRRWLPGETKEQGKPTSSSLKVLSLNGQI